MATLSEDTPKKRRVNGWKVGFFVALFAFEVTREFAVLVSNEKPRLSAQAIVYEFKGWVTAQGRWVRIDGGVELLPVAVTIKCRPERGECIEATVNVNDMRVGVPEMTTYPAQFSPDAVVYNNTFPVCAHYRTRIDLRLKKVLSVRERTGDKSKLCEGTEERIEMQLADGWKPERPLEGHFLPVLQAVSAVANWLD